MTKSPLQGFDSSTMTKLIEAIIQVWHHGSKSRKTV